MNYANMYPRIKKAQKKGEGYDTKLNLALETINQRCPEEWDVILDYIVSKSIMPEPLADDTDNFLAREAAKKSAYVRIYRRLALVDKT